MRSRRPSPRSRAAAAVAALALAATACSSGGGTDQNLADIVAAQGEAQEAIRQRLVELEDGVSSVLSVDQAGEFQGVNEALTTIQESVASLDTLSADLAERLETAETDLTAATTQAADVDGQLDALGEQLASLISSVDLLQDSLDGLRDDLGSLETQFQRHRDDDAHGG